MHSRRCHIRKTVVELLMVSLNRSCIESNRLMSAKIIPANTLDEYWFQEGCHIIEVSNYPADPQVSIARARVEAGATTRWHRLENTWERYLIVQGEGVAEIGDLAPARVAPGDVVVIPPGVRQRIRSTGTRDLVFYAICSPRFTPACYRDLEV